MTPVEGYNDYINAVFTNVSLNRHYVNLSSNLSSFFFFFFFFKNTNEVTQERQNHEAQPCRGAERRTD